MKIVFFSIAFGLVLLSSTSVVAQTTERTISRLFWQDASDQRVYWGDLKRADGSFSLDKLTIANFPELDIEKQSHVQMELVDDTILSGVHDDEDGIFASGWVAIKTGASREEHGDHAHWHFEEPPSILQTKIDSEQGNPAHVYVYSDRFYLANDKKNGFTEVAKDASESSSKLSSQFVSAGGGHITLAVVDGTVAYSTWIDRDGDNMGRVDVVGLGDAAERRYSIYLPSGGIHGATTNSKRVFFAPADGVYWVEADTKVSGSTDSTKVNHLSLGNDGAGNPLRTGAFVNHRNHVLCLVGRGPESKLAMIDASSESPVLSTLPIELAAGTSLSSLSVVQSRNGQELALVVQESPDGQARRN